MFTKLTEGADVMIDERKDKDINRTIKYGQGKSRMEQLSTKGNMAKDPHGTMLSAKEFTTQLERLNKEMEKFWSKEDKVACIRIAI
jgi:hypothetical protein